MMKRIHILLMALLAGILCHAQLLPTDSTRYGAKDPQKAIELYKLVFAKNSPLTQGNERMPVTEEFYINFKRLADLAPYVNYYPYSGYYYENPTSLYQRMLDSIADPAFKVMLVEDAVACGQMFVDHLDSINVVRDWNPQTKGNPLTMPLAKIKRAHYNYKFAHDPKYYPAHLYDKEKAYELYREAFKEFLAAKEEQGGGELEPYYLNEYFKTCEDLYKTDEEKYYEQFLTDYQEIVQVFDKLLIPYYDIPDTIKNNLQDPNYKQYQQYNYWLNASIAHNNEDDGIKVRFAASGAADAARLKQYFAPRLEPNKKNKEFLDNAISFMYNNGFVNDSVFLRYCQASYDLGKTYENCIGLGYFAAKTDKEKMIQYFQNALSVSTSDEQRAVIHYQIAVALFSTKPAKKLPEEQTELSEEQKKLKEEYEQWEADVNRCNANLKNMLKYSNVLRNSSSLARRNSVADAYYMIGDNNYCLAAVKYVNRQFVQASLLADTAVVNYKKADELKFKPHVINGVATNIEARMKGLTISFGTNKKDGQKLPGLCQLCKKAITELKQNAKLQAEYEEWQRKKKAEEEFWKQK